MPDLRKLLDNKENCRRSIISNVLGRIARRIACCGVGGTERLLSVLRRVFPSAVPVTARRSWAHTVPRQVCNELRAALLIAREQIVDPSTGFQMLGIETVYSTEVFK